MYVKYEIRLRDCKMCLVLFIMYVIFVSSYFFNLKKKILHHIIWYLFSFFSSQITSNRNPKKKKQEPHRPWHSKDNEFHNFGEGLDGQQSHAFNFFPTCVKVKEFSFILAIFCNIGPAHEAEEKLRK